MSGRNGNGAGPSAFSTYASKFLAGQIKGKEVEGSQIFRQPSPASSTHDPFLHSPTSQSHPRLAGSSRSPSPARTPPFPGPGIDEIPDIDGSGVGMGLLFGDDLPPTAPPTSGPPAPARSASRRGKSSVPNPYAASSESDEEIEPDLEDVAQIRRSLLRPGANIHSQEYRHSQSHSRSPSQPRSHSQSQGQQAQSGNRAKKGWLAHQSVFPPSSESEDESDSEKETEDETEDERTRISGMDMMGRSRRKLSTSVSRVERDLSLSPSDLYRESIQTDVTAGDMQEPLLGPDEVQERRGPGKVPVRLHLYHGRFGHWEREGLRKYKDTGVLALWLSSLFAVVFGLLFVWGATDPPPEAPSHRTAPSIVPLLPLLLVLLIPPLIIPPAFLLLLQKTVRPVLLATAISIPFSLFVCGWWAIGASFETYGWDGIDQGERWWGTSGLRILAVILWALAAWFGRLVWIRRKRLERTVAVVELSTHLLLTHPPLLLLTPLLLGVFALTSIPFLTLLVRLGMIGYWRHPRENTYIFQLRPYAGWLIFLVTLVWVWTWGVIRGVGRVAVAAVVGAWYFHRHDPHHPPPLEITQAAVHRATGTSLGSICIGAGIVAIVRTVGRAAAEMKRLTSGKNKVIPPWLSFITRLTPIFAIVAGVLDQLNGYALVYVGITGDGFWPSARRAVGLAGRRKGGHLLDYTLIKLLLTLSSTAMGLFTGTAGYLYMAHSLSNPAYAPVAGLLCGGVPFLAVRAGAAVLGDAADALFICYQIDRELGGANSEEAKEAFAGEKAMTGAAAA